LYYHLKQANQAQPPDTEPEIASSVATRLPLIGPIWRLIRHEAHHLVLFYVKRIVSHNALLQGHVVSTLNEMTRLIQAQEEEIVRLKQGLKELRNGAEKNSDS
jgi:hypothetical protein